MAFTIDLHVDINAPLETVWEVITDLPRYGDWNPFVVQCESTLMVGAPINMQVKLLSKPQAQQEFIFRHEPKQFLSYGLDGGSLRAIVSDRWHEVKALGPDRTHYHSHFELSGWMMPLVRMLMRAKLEIGFRGMTDGIKTQSEKLYKARK
jgi:hypothetical protein